MSTLDRMLNRLHEKKNHDDPPQEKAKEILNCWEFKRCGNEDRCVAAKDPQHNGFFGGTNGGRFCAFIGETLCFDATPRSTTEKLEVCVTCEFYHELMASIFPSYDKGKEWAKARKMTP